MTAFAGSYTSDGSADVAVNAEVSPSWQVTVPARVDLVKTSGTRDTYGYDYTINCFGLIADDKCVYVYPTNDTFTMTGESGHDTVSASVTQNKKYFVSDSVSANYVPNADNAYVTIAGSADDYTETKGTLKGSISAKFTKSDKYDGVLNISFGYSDLQ